MEQSKEQQMPDNPQTTTVAESAQQSQAPQSPTSSPPTPPDNIQQQSQQPEDTKPSTSSKKSKGKKGSLIVLIVVLFTILIGIVLFLHIQSQSAEIGTTKTSVKDDDPTANWKSYTNRSFSFKYPPDWMYGEDSSKHNRKGLNIYLRPSLTRPVDETYGEINLWVFESEKSIKEFVNTEICYTSSGCSPSEIKVSDLKAVLVKNILGPQPSEATVVKNNNVIVEFDFIYQGESYQNYSNKKSKVIFDQILSTFRFTN